jgi:NhaP-type Na+/H+ and K+/H+ antiporter
MTALLTVFALIAGVLMLAALVSGLVERAPLSFPIVFLGLGFLMGERGLGLIRADLFDTSLEAIAMALSFVLFLDA